MPFNIICIELSIKKSIKKNNKKLLIFFFKLNFLSFKKIASNIGTTKNKLDILFIV